MDTTKTLELANNFEKLAKKYNKPRKGMKSRWSMKYKKNINCSNPKGFSQKAYCARKRRGGAYKNDVNDLEWLDQATKAFKEKAQEVADAVSKKVEELKKAYENKTLLPKEFHEALDKIKWEGKEKVQQVAQQAKQKPAPVSDKDPELDQEIEEESEEAQESIEQKIELLPDEIEGGIDKDIKFVPQAPIKGDYKSSGGFGTKKPDGRIHDGVDLRSPSGGGTPVYPIESGEVVKITTEESGVNKLGGNTVTVEHSDKKHRSYYAHLKDIYVSVGDMVDKETEIGTIGNSGNARGTAPHVHLKVTKDGVAIDPATLFSVPGYQPFDPETEKT